MEMSSVAGVLISCLVNSVWEIPLVGGAGWLVGRALRRLGPRAEHAVWVSTLALAILTPALPLFRWLMELLRDSRGGHEALSIVSTAAQTGGPNAAGVFVIPATFVLPLFVVYAGVCFTSRRDWCGRCIGLTSCFDAAVRFRLNRRRTMRGGAADERLASMAPRSPVRDE